MNSLIVSSFLNNCIKRNQNSYLQFLRNGSFRASKPIGILDQYTSNYEVTNNPDEWKYIEMILPKEIVPIPTVKAEYPSGWVKPSENANQYPYFVARTKNFMQPVYLQRTFRGMKRITCIRRIQGDIWKLEEELKQFLESKHKEMIPSQVNELSGIVKFKGDHVNKVREWLNSKGF